MCKSFIDFVYFEISSAAPYQVRKIEELNKVRNLLCLRHIFYLLFNYEPIIISAYLTRLPKNI